MVMEIKLSIVVPTKDRHFYLKYLVKYFTSIDSIEIELVIYDNSSVDQRKIFLSFLNSIADERIKYFQNSEELSQTENCDLAVSEACGEFISLLGDDDIFSKHILTYIDKWRADQIEAILPIKGTYLWPDVRPRLYGDRQSGMFKSGLLSNKIESINSSHILRKVICSGGSEIYNLPRIYHGIVSRKILDKIFEDCGSYFPGPSPDMANAVAICKYVKNYIIIDAPLIISGQSVLSAGGKGAEGRHYGEITEIKQLPKNTGKEWSKGVPYYWSGKTIYAESVLKALEKMKMDEYLDDFNYEYLYASCLVFDSNYRQRIVKCYRENIRNINGLKFLYYYVSIWMKRFNFHVKNNMSLIMPRSLKLSSRVSYRPNILDVALINDGEIEEHIINRIR